MPQVWNEGPTVTTERDEAVTRPVWLTREVIHDLVSLIFDLADYDAGRPGGASQYRALTEFQRRAQSLRDRMGQ